MNCIFANKISNAFFSTLDFPERPFKIIVASVSWTLKSIFIHPVCPLAVPLIPPPMRVRKPASLTQESLFPPTHMRAIKWSVLISFYICTSRHHSESCGGADACVGWGWSRERKRQAGREEGRWWGVTGPGSRCKSSDVSCLLTVDDGATRSRGGVEMNHF